MVRRGWSAAALAVAVCGMAAAGPSRAADSFGYTVSIKAAKGDLPGDLESQMNSVSRLVSGQDKPPPGLAGLEQRADSDHDTLQKVLRAQGYYDGDINIAIDDSKSPVKVTVRVAPGPLYTLHKCKITYLTPAPAGAPKDCDAIGLHQGQGAKAEPIITATSTLERKLQEVGRPAAKVQDRIAVVNHLTKKMRLNFKLDPGPAAIFGPVTIDGAKNTDHDFLARLVPWDKGQRYDVRELDKYRQRLADLNLFDTLVVKPDTDKIAPDGTTPIDVKAHERLPHSVALGVKYATDTGFGGKASWENRNLWGRAEDLNLSIELGTLGQSLNAALTLPHEPHTGQSLGLSVTTTRQTTDAYDLNGLTGLAQITSPLGGNWSGKAGVGFEAATVDQGGNGVTDLLVTFPVSATFDSTGSLLDPKKGERWSSTIKPVFGTSGGERAFLILQTEASAYRALDDDKKIIAAGRLKLGTILFSPEAAVPPDLRFYAGGGGSVRGYAYQHVSPRNANGLLIGGRSLAEASAELRYKAWENIGIVGFVDAGMVSTSPYFATDATPRVGAGLGVRYYTSFGPLRLDVGVPLNPHHDDAPVQIYISLGQAF